MQERRLSISNIAWPADKDDEALALVAALGFNGIEVAPGKIFGDLKAVSLDDVRAYRHRVEDRGLSVSALQAIFFGVQGAHLFESSAARQRMASHLQRVAEIAWVLGAKACVFGSPTLRDPGEVPRDQAWLIAEAFLRQVAPDYASRCVELCFEANPEFYQCRFVTRTEEAFELIQRVDAPGIALQLDTGTIFLNREDPSVIGRVEQRIGHFHVSEPNLVPVGTAGVDHARVAGALKSSAYPHWVSIEMRAADDWQGAIRQAFAMVHSLYCATDSTP